MSGSHEINIKRGVRITVVTVILVLFCIGAFVVHLSQSYTQPPVDFPLNQDIYIEPGSTTREVAESLEAVGALKSALVFRLYFISHFKNQFAQAGVYSFTEPLTMERLAEALARGEYRSPHVRITFPEGFRSFEFKDYVPESFVLTDSTLQQYEGYLFPDTYFIDKDMSSDELIALMRNTFDSKIIPYLPEIDAKGTTIQEVVILASIIEREAKDAESKKMVSSVLHNRLVTGMPLQADATLNYILGKTSAELTQSDLAINSPYNSYTRKSLPPTPISNPGIESIEAALRPATSEYFFYLTAPDGTFYYAKTFEEHKRNKERYLR